MSKPAYNILTMSKSEYLRYHWARTEKARIKLWMNEMEWHMIWAKNYWMEYAAALEKELAKTRERLKEVLEEKLDEI